MAAGLELAGIALTVVQEIYAVADTVSTNKRRCVRLRERVSALKPILEQLSEGSQERTASIDEALNHTTVVLVDARALLEKYRQARWYRHVRRVYDFKTEFVDVNERLQSCTTNLQLGLAMETSANLEQWRSEDEKDARMDVQAMHELLQEMKRTSAEAERPDIESALQELNTQFKQELDELATKQEGIIRQIHEAHADNRANVADAVRTLQNDLAHLRNDMRAMVRHQGPRVENEIARDKLELLKRIGAGGFGQVWFATYYGTPVAVKMLPFAAASSGEMMRRLKREAATHQMLRHANVVSFIGASTVDPSEACLVLEYAGGGTLFDKIHSAPLPPIAAVAYARDIVCGLTYLHDRQPHPVHHCDLTSRNVLVGNDGALKLSDFGLARVTAQASLQPSVETRQGTPAWMAPELLDNTVTIANHKWDKIDVYALGIIFFELVAQEEPWAGLPIKTICVRVVTGTRPVIPDAKRRRANSTVLRVMADCWTQNPDMRPALPGGALVRALTDAYVDMGGKEELAEHLAAVTDVPPLRVAVDGPTSPVPSPCSEAATSAVSHGVFSSTAAAPDPAAATESPVVTPPRPPHGYNGVRVFPTGASPLAESTAASASRVVPEVAAPPSPAPSTPHATQSRARAMSHSLEDVGADGVVAHASDLAAGSDARLADVEAYLRAQLLAAEHAGRNDLDLAMLLDELGAIVPTGAESEGLHRRALELRVRSGKGVRDADVIQSQGYLGRALSRQGNFGGADKLLRQAAKSATDVFGAEDPAVANLLRLHGAALSALGQHKDAIAQFEKALAIVEGTLGPTDTLAAATQTDLGNALRAAGRLADAEACLARAANAPGLSPRDTSRVNGSLALTQQERRRYDEAEASYSRCIETLRSLPSARHELATAYNNYAELMQVQGKLTAAQLLLEEAIVIKNDFDPKSPSLAFTCANLAANLYLQGKFQEAEPIVANAVPILDAAHHPDAARAHRLQSRILAKMRAF